MSDLKTAEPPVAEVLTAAQEARVREIAAQVVLRLLGDPAIIDKAQTIRALTDARDFLGPSVQPPQESC